MKVAGRELTCEFDGQTHLIPETDVRKTRFVVASCLEEMCCYFARISLCQFHDVCIPYHMLFSCHHHSFSGYF